MSLYADREDLLMEKNAWLETHLEVERQNSRIAKLEQEVHDLKMDMRVPAGKPDEQAFHSVMSPGSSNLNFREEYTHLQRLISEKDAMIAGKDAALASMGAAMSEKDAAIRQFEESNSALLSQSDMYREMIDESADRLEDKARSIESTFDEGESTLENGPTKSDMYRETVHEAADWLREAISTKSTFDGADEEGAKDPTSEDEEKE